MFTVQCSRPSPSSPTVEGIAPPTASNAVGDSTTSTPARGIATVCKSAGSNVSGTFTVATVSGTPTIIQNPITIPAGECRVVGENLSGPAGSAQIRVTETSAGFQSATAVTCTSASAGAPCTVLSSASFSNGGTVEFDNNGDFPHGVTITVTNNVAPPAAVAQFVIGDVEPHAINDVVNFWGAQWWKNNQMSGFVSPGRASFKGYATKSDNTCGGTWASLPGNSSNPPQTIPSVISVIVTDTLVKNGNAISGHIKQIVNVRQDGGYGPAPGHDGNGPVISVVCSQ